jgi:hypothetical protein
VLLSTVSAGPRKLTIEDAQLTHLTDLETFPTVRRSASAFAADLIAEQAFDATADTVVVWLYDATSSCFVHELD